MSERNTVIHLWIYLCL